MVMGVHIEGQTLCDRCIKDCKSDYPIVEDFPKRCPAFIQKEYLKLEKD